MFRRATSIPAWMSATKVAGSRLAGPIVQTILVRSIDPPRRARGIGFTSLCRRLITGCARSGRSAIRFRQFLESVAQGRSEHSLRKSPAPVAACPAGRVHAALAAHAENVLEREDRGLGHRHQGEADQLPVQLIATRAQVPAQGGAFLLA